MTHHSDPEQRFLDNVRQTLDTAAESLDGRTQSRLTQARYKALQADKPRGRWQVWPAGAILATVTLLLLLIPQYEDKTVTISKTEMIEGLEDIIDRENLEFYRDLEFYYWLATENIHAG
jgi:hypothetical protein